MEEITRLKKLKKKEYDAQYYQKNKEKNKERDSLRYIENRDEKIKYQQNYYENVQKGSDARKKTVRLYNWKKSGVICEDFNKLYEYYLNTNECEKCNIPLVSGQLGANKKCLDHNHITGLFRNILCQNCNLKATVY
jgi:hypothetical protein